MCLLQSRNGIRGDEKPKRPSTKPRFPYTDFWPGTLRQSMVWMFTLRMVRFHGGVVLLHGVIGLGVVLVVVNLLARIVLLMIDLRALLLRELAAVGRAIIVHFVVDVRLSAFEVAGLTGS
jgi:hypothetical protein